MDHLPRKPRRLRRLFAVAAVIGLAIAGVVGVQQFAFAAAPAPISTFDNGSGLCLQPYDPDPNVSLYSNGIGIWQRPCDGSLQQQWKKVFLTNGHHDCGFPWIGRCGFDRTDNVYYLVNQLTLACMDVTNASGSDFTAIQQWQCNGGGSEKWWLPPADAAVGQFRPFENFRTHSCLDVPYATRNVTAIWQVHCTDNNAAQVFSVPPS